jgi:hypothetical protein
MAVSGRLNSLAALSQGKTLDVRWIGGWMGPRISFDVVTKIIPCV